jgi:hypothetical protein
MAPMTISLPVVRQPGGPKLVVSFYPSCAMPWRLLQSVGLRRLEHCGRYHTWLYTAWVCGMIPAHLTHSGRPPIAPDAVWHASVSLACRGVSQTQAHTYL